MRGFYLAIAIFAVTLTGCGVDWFPSAPKTVSITTTTLADGAVSQAYSQTLNAFGGSAPYTWSTTSGTLPPGLTLDAATGVISGTPTTAGTSNFTIQVSDSSTPATTASQALTILIASQSTTLAPGASITLQSGQSVKVPINSTLTLNGSTTILNGTQTTVTTSAGAVVSVPITATTEAVITVIAQ